MCCRMKDRSDSRDKCLDYGFAAPGARLPRTATSRWSRRSGYRFCKRRFGNRRSAWWRMCRLLSLAGRWLASVCFFRFLRTGQRTFRPARRPSDKNPANSYQISPDQPSFAAIWGSKARPPCVRFDASSFDRWVRSIIALDYPGAQRGRLG